MLSIETIGMKLAQNNIISHLLLAIGGSLIILAGLFYATSNIQHDISPSRLVEVLKASSIGFLVYFVLTMIAGLFFRAWRYKALLSASGDANIPNFRSMLLITAVRNMTVDLLPARLGELVFVGLLKRYANTQVSSGLSTLLFATLLDILVLGPITICIGLIVGFPTKQPYLLALIALGAVVGFVLTLYFILPLFMGWFSSMSCHRNKLIRGFFGFVLSIAHAVQTTMQAGVFVKVMGLTFIIRFLKYGGLLCLFFGISQVSFPQLAELGSLKILGSLIASEMTASLPIPALMSFGTWELGGMTLLAYFGAIPQHALLTMLGVHVQTQAIDYGVGITSLAVLLLYGRKQVGQKNQAANRKRILAALFVATAMGFTWFGLKDAKQQQTLFSMQDSTGVVRPDNAPVPAWINEADGYVVWSSNRTGNHDIWLMTLPDLKIRPLTTDGHTENFARISPDGKKVVFARAHKQWQSTRDDKPWDIWVLDIDTGKQRLLAKWGVSPAWSPDGSFVVFQRDPGQIIAVDIKSGKQRLYYESGKDAFMKTRVNLNTPTIGEGQRMAFTFRNHGQPTNIIRDERGKFQTVHRDACQVQWAPSGKYTMYVQKGGRQTNQIMRFDPVTKTKTTLLDLPGEFSHEYFARLTNNEQYMVLAASNGGHEHDLADYELFLWKVGSNAAQATRLTFNSGNDSWPDVWIK